MHAPLIDVLRPILDVCDLKVAKVEVDAPTGDVTLDGVTISMEISERRVWYRPPVYKTEFVPVIQYAVSYAVGIAQTREEPPDVDVVEVGTYATPAEALAATLGVIIQQRVAAYQDRLADEEAALACQDDGLPSEA